jgi:cyclase
MKTVRIIPRLDVKGPNLVKGIHLEGLRVLGRPSDFAKYYYDNGADELLFMDVVASLYDRNSLHSIIEDTAKKIFIPITVGGGVRSLEDIKSILRAGADKVSINTAAIKNPELIRDASREFGSSTIVVAIEAIKDKNGKYYAFTDNGREFTELIITSVDKEGTGKGFDIDLIKMIADNVSIPIIAHGGAGSKEDIENLFDNNIVDSVALASILHYDAIKHLKMNVNQNEEGNFDFINSGKSKLQLSPICLSDLKLHLHSKEINCR